MLGVKKIKQLKRVIRDKADFAIKQRMLGVKIFVQRRFCASALCATLHSIDYNLFFFNNNYPLNTSHKIIENGVGFFFSPLVSTEKEKKVQRVGPDEGKVIAAIFTAII